METLGNKHGPLVEVKLEPGVPPKVGKVEEGRRASDEGGKRKLAGCRCGNATLCPGKLTCCGQRCPCYVDNLACTGSEFSVFHCKLTGELTDKCEAWQIAGVKCATSKIYLVF